MKKRFIFDEGYIKRYAKRDRIRWLVIGLSLLVLIVVIIIVMLATRDDKPIKPDPVVPKYEFKDKLTIEAGSELPEVVDYFKEYENVDINDVKLEYPEELELSYDVSACSEDIIEELNNGAKYDEYDCVKSGLKTPKVYNVSIILYGNEHTVNLEVVDTVSPTIVTKNVEIYEGSEYKLEDFVNSCYDVTSECVINYYDKDQVDYSNIKEVGEHVVKLVASDNYKNVSEPFEAKLIIKEPVSKLFTVTFNSDGGTNIDKIVVEEGKTVKEPSKPHKDGYNFLGWYLGNNAFNFNTSINKDITLVAKWEKIKIDGGNDGDTTVSVSSITLSSNKIYVYVGDTKTITATVKPNNATNKTVSWKSHNKGVATVVNGKIKGVKVGETVVTASAGGKSASVTVIVKEKVVEPTCTFGDTKYNNKLYVLSVNLTSNNCAIDPNKNYNDEEGVSTKDYQNIVSKLTNMGFSVGTGFDYKLDTVKVKNNAGTGLVGYQYTVTITVINPDNPYRYMSAKYIIKSDGSRQFISNNIERNGVKLS